ncbi:mRNA polyadenylation factor [Lithospermum erythrorhizon]|uniref:mRNA polyadenylation factor n=1 Tax=Lithospermum erythrorhizon TaxID=34254 RepID=A0AAV3PIX2_LITER
MIPLSSTIASQIRFLLQSVTDSNSDDVFKQLSEYTSYGIDGSILLLQTCFDHFNVYTDDMMSVRVEPLFPSVFRYLLDKPNFGTVLCESLKSVAVSEGFLQKLSSALQLSTSEKIGVGLALSESEKADIRICGKNFLMGEIGELSGKHIPLGSAEQIQNILVFLHQSDGLSKNIDTLLKMSSLEDLKEKDQFILAPLLSDELREANFLRSLDMFDESTKDDFDAILEEMENEMSMADIMKELGYGCTVHVSQCKEILSLFLPLTELTVAKIISTVARTYTGLEGNQNMFSTFRSALGTPNVPDLPAVNSWNAGVLVEAIKQLAPATNWTAVVEKLDHEGFCIPNEEAFLFFMSVYRRACQEPFPLHAICGSVWENAEGQLSFLKYAVLVPPEVFTFAHSARQLSYVDAVNDHKFQNGHTNHAWLCLELLEVMCYLAEKGHAVSVRLMLEYPLKHCPELLILGMAHVHSTYNLLQNEVSSYIFPAVLKNPAGIGMILHLWHVNPNLLLRGFVDAASVDHGCILRILDACQELKILSAVLDATPSAFSIRLAALASRRDLVDLENWLITNLNTYKDNFYEECIKLLKEVQIGTQGSPTKRFHPSGALWNIFLETSPTFLKVLQSHGGLISSGHLSEEVERLHMSFKNGPGTDSSASDGYADDIEAEANSYFHQMFSGVLSVDALIQMLSRLKESSEKRDQSIFECMIANLFEEYKFFPKYPETELRIAAILYGSLIKHRLVTHLTLGIALRAVLEALRKPMDSRMFVFGTRALELFVDRLIEWPQYCNHILQISHLRATQPELVAFIERALARISATHSEKDTGSNGVVDTHHASIQPTVTAAESVPPIASSGSQPNLQVSSPVKVPQRPQIQSDDKGFASLYNHMKSPVPSGTQPSVLTSSDTTSLQKSTLVGSTSSASSPAFVRSSRAITSARFGSALNIETLVAAAERKETQIDAPASEVQDKISFIINNLSAANIEAKAKEFIEVLKEEYYPWFAQYLVMKRASIEPNFHDLYLKFLDKVNSRALNKETVQATYENCKVLLRSELIKSSSEERSLLKNLGSWLGKITIGRNQVLRAREIDPKSLILKAYERGLMIAVIPFTSKVLEPCQSSLAYQPPNPWTMGILGLLSEIYAMPNLKMNLKFDIEVLFKNLGVDLKDVTPTSLLKDRNRQVDGNPDFSTKDVGAPQAPVVGEAKSGIVPPVNQAELPLEVGGTSHPGGQSHVLSQFAAPLHLSSGTLTEDEKLAALGLADQLPSARNLMQGKSPFSVNQLSRPLSNTEQKFIVNSKFQTLGLHLPFQSVLPIAMDRAIKEIVANIVQRSVTISTKTTKELVLKDYAMETDENRVHKAAHLMVASLAGSLAHVTCKEQLRSAISGQLRNLLQGLNVTGEMLEQTIQLATNDNLDLGCALIEEAATDKAIQAIDVEIAQHLALRRKRREGGAVAYIDSSLYTTGHMSVLPDALRPKPGRLSHSQQRVYEDFVRLPWQSNSGQNSNSVGPSASSSFSDLSRAFPSISGQMNPGMYSSGPVKTSSASVPQGLDTVSQEIETYSIQPHSALPIGVGMSEGASPLSSENDPVISLHSVSAPELLPAEPSDSKDLGSSIQPLNSISASESAGINPSEPLLTTGDVLDKYQIISEKLENLVASDAKESEIQGLVGEVPMIILRSLSRDESALAVAQKVLKGLYENSSSSAHVKAYLAMLTAIRDVSKLMVKELTSWVIYSEEERKFNKEITIGLIHNELLNIAEYNLHMAKLLDGGRNKAATDFAAGLIQILVTNDVRVLSELQNLVDALAKVAARPGSPESLQQLVEIAKNPAANVASLSSVSAMKEDISLQLWEKKVTNVAASGKDYNSTAVSAEPDPVFNKKVSMFFADWYRICETPGVNDAAYARYVLQLQQNGFLKGDDTTDRFFRQIMDLSVSHCLSSEVIASGPSQSHQVQPLSFLAIDIYAKLSFAILKFYPVDLGSGTLSLLPKVLGLTVRFIQKDAEEKKSLFNPRPYFRLFINWLSDLCSLDPVSDGANFQVLTALSDAFHALQPSKVPGFSFAWLELVSQRSFMPKLLSGNGQKGWFHFQRLLVDLFQFMEPFLRNAELEEPVHFLYKGTLRVLLVLLHDFPEFLCDYHFSFCDVIPPSCIQMRNIILSAFPRNMRLPDPSTPNLKIDLLDEISQSPRILSEVDGALKANQIKNDLDEYLKVRQQGSQLLSELKQKLLLPPSESSRAGTRYNVPLMNSLVLYVGMQAIPHAQSMASGGPLVGFLVGAALDIFQTLILELDTEGRYLFLNAIANQLRYPNNHTHYFSFILLYLFSESNQEVIEEQITRVLLERLIVDRPHPWGLLITFIELIKNPRYNFWSRSFTRCAPEIERLFESVSRSCGGPKPVDEGVVSGGGIADALH